MSLWLLWGLAFAFLFLVLLWPKSTKNLPPSGRRTEEPKAKEFTNLKSSQYLLLFPAGESHPEKTSWDSFLQWLSEEQIETYEWRILASADLTGNQATNRKLIKSRNQFVKRALIEKGVDRDTISDFDLEPKLGATLIERQRLRSVRIERRPKAS